MAETELPTRDAQTTVQETDVLIIGGGLAGTCAATALSRKGYDVTLISTHDRHPPDFRAEKIGEDQMVLFERIGLSDAVRTQMTAFDGVWLHRFGRIVERGTKREYGSDYSDLVNALRRALPQEVHAVIGRVEDIETTADRQNVVLSDGRKFSARLLVVATGLGDAIRKKLGVERDIISPQHSLCCGFDLAKPRGDFPFPSLVWNGERFNDRVSYLTLFPIENKIRANFFVYRNSSDEWTRSFRDHPEQSMRVLMPGLERMFGEMKVTGPVIARPIDLVRVHNHERDGMILIGDAFCVVCPITGTGIDKALTDVDRLCNVYIPRWFESPGMAAAKISEFYADPVKTARDESAMKMSLHSKSIKTETGFYWKLRRLRSSTLGRARYVVRSAIKRLKS
ncbi:FAD-dependent oxidoreductase [Phyllobacterium myrsinacearum]|uniref:2-polyprenyl-6-methoxyphenol hydroxylase-like FAD-dependent oxidoreductase n=1 Tax=Phyllobacterium myrsinacearum TaxID=28101 RepID=A0A839ETL1_9HYPH|nr:NAD(P)/FAD-dependent oxidoreductase [Phyllobacterium myrsinacearum]MBA8881518.1 2-polyprenyl-6-methoxyphenol hydroxylase-like FAD-dependent oxidoreductase [Phyllobacterium myrsinacearum]